MGVLHFELDGHPANLWMVNFRRQDVIDASVEIVGTERIPAVSLHHCGNHRNNLVENSVVDTIGLSYHAFLITGAAFFRMSSNFLRAAQALGPLVSGNMVAPVLGAAPVRYTLMAAELKDYSLKNYK